MTRDEAITAAGEVYGAILADPERREQLRRARAAKGAATSARPDSPSAERRKNEPARRRSA